MTTTKKRGRVRTSEEVTEKAIQEGRATPEGVAGAYRELLVAESAYKLRQLREKIGESQRALARTLQISQPAISKLEAGDVDHTRVGTLASYVAALGGHLRLVADFGNARVEITGDDHPRSQPRVLRALSEIEEEAGVDAIELEKRRSAAAHRASGSGKAASGETAVTGRLTTREPTMVAAKRAVVKAPAKQAAAVAKTAASKQTAEKKSAAGRQAAAKKAAPTKKPTAKRASASTD